MNLDHQIHTETTVLTSLNPHPGNPRTHSKKQLSQIAKSIERFGFTTPILIDSEDMIIAGHGRVEAARLLGMTVVPTIRLDYLTKAEARAYVVADNRLAELAEWDRELLASELECIAELDVEFDLSLTGFETGEIDVLLEESRTSAPDPRDEIPERPNADEVCTREGDLWQLGPHRLLCGDARNDANYRALLAGKRAALAFVDPPYNVPIRGHVSGLGTNDHPEFAMASGEMTSAEFTGFLSRFFGHLIVHTTDGSIHFICMDWRHAENVTAAASGLYTEFKNLCVWTKTNAGMGSLYRSQHELVFVYKNGTKPHVNNVALGAYGRHRTNVWSYPGVNTFREGRDDELRMHPTVKPTALVADAIRDCSRRGDLVLDCFGGSGTTLIAADQCGRGARLIELAPGYVDTTIERYLKLTGEPVIHEQSGLRYEALREQRRRDTGDSTAVGASATEVTHV